MGRGRVRLAGWHRGGERPWTLLHPYRPICALQPASHHRAEADACPACPARRPATATTRPAAQGGGVAHHCPEGLARRSSPCLPPPGCPPACCCRRRPGSPGRRWAARRLHRAAHRVRCVLRCRNTRLSAGHAGAALQTLAPCAARPACRSAAAAAHASRRPTQQQEQQEQQQQRQQRRQPIHAALAPTSAAPEYPRAAFRPALASGGVR